jgi:hypothetical protein
MEGRSCSGGVFTNIFLGVGIALLGFFLGRSVEKAVEFVATIGNTITVKGLSERYVKSDEGDISVTFEVTGDDQEVLFKRMKTTQDSLRDFLATSQIQPNEFVFSPPVLHDRHADFVATKWNTAPPKQKYRVSSSLKIHSSNVDTLKDFYKNAEPIVSSLMKSGRDEGLCVTVHTPSYTYSKLESIRSEIIDEATRSARVAAAQFEKNSGSKISTIKSASQGNVAVECVHDGVTKRVRVICYVTYALT